MAIVEVVQYEGRPDIFAWKYPNAELGTWSQVIVNESQEAILFKGGQALDVLGSGRHTLETANIPLLNKIINLPFGGRSPFTAEIWYINKTHSLDIKWGTPTPIQLQDPKYKVFVPLRSFGQFGVRIDEAKMFLTKLVGTLPIFDKKNLVDFFRGLYLANVKNSISEYLINKGISVLEINAYLLEISEYLRGRITPTLDEYGIKLINFYVNDISVPEGDPAVIKLRDALSKKAEMDIVGYNYIQQRSFDTLEGAATNPGSAQSGVMGAGLGMGMGFGMGGSMGSQMGELTRHVNLKGMKKCPSCNADMDESARFCPGCGHDAQRSASQKGSASQITECSGCGITYSRKYKFCPGCGAAYNPCSFCGADMKKGSAVCQSCGKAAPRPCPKCGCMIDNANSKFCPECGHKLQGE